MTMATLSNVQQMMEFEELDIRYIVSAVLYNIPAIVIAVVNGVLIWQLKCLLKTDQFSSSTTNEIRRVLFQVRLTNLIAIIFVGSQVSFALWIGLHIVSSFPFVFYIFKGISSTFRNDFLFTFWARPGQPGLSSGFPGRMCPASGPGFRNRPS